MIDGLFDAVVEHVKIFLLEIQHEFAVSVASSNRRRNFRDANSYRFLLRLPWLRRRAFR